MSARLRVGLIGSGDDNSNTLLRLLVEQGIQVVHALEPKELTEQHIRDSHLDVWLLDLDDAHWHNKLDELMDHSNVPIFFNEHQSIAQQAHLDYWARNLISRMEELAGDSEMPVTPSEAKASTHHIAFSKTDDIAASKPATTAEAKPETPPTLKAESKAESRNKPEVRPSDELTPLPSSIDPELLKEIEELEQLLQDKDPAERNDDFKPLEPVRLRTEAGSDDSVKAAAQARAAEIAKAQEAARAQQEAERSAKEAAERRVKEQAEREQQEAQRRAAELAEAERQAELKRQQEAARRAEEARLAAEKAEAERQAEIKRQQQAAQREAERLEALRQEEQRQAEEARIAEQARQEALRQAELKRQQEAKLAAEQEAARRAEEARLAAEKAEAERQAEIKRQQEAAAREAARLEALRQEELRKAEEARKAEQARQEVLRQQELQRQEQQRLAAEQEAARQAEQARIAAEQAEAERQAEIQRQQKAAEREAERQAFLRQEIERQEAHRRAEQAKKAEAEQAEAQARQRQAERQSEAEQARLLAEAKQTPAEHNRPTSAIDELLRQAKTELKSEFGRRATDLIGRNLPEPPASTTHPAPAKMESLADLLAKAKSELHQAEQGSVENEAPLELELPFEPELEFEEPQPSAPAERPTVLSDETDIPVLTPTLSNETDEAVPVLSAERIEPVEFEPVEFEALSDFEPVAELEWESLDDSVTAEPSESSAAEPELAEAEASEAEPAMPEIRMQEGEAAEVEFELPPSEPEYAELPTVSPEVLSVPMLEAVAGGDEFEELEGAPVAHTPLPCDLWVIGASLGGPAALKRFFAALNEPLPVCFLLVQHIDPHFLPVLGKILESANPFYRVDVLSRPGLIEPGTILLAPVEKRLWFLDGAQVVHSPHSWTPPYSPCINDVLHDVANAYPAQSHAIVFSGMGEDGVSGAEAMHRAGGDIWVQDADSCASAVMPDAIDATGIVGLRATPEQLAEKLTQRYLQKTQTQHG